jgi:hypothetical protein
MGLNKLHSHNSHEDWHAFLAASGRRNEAMLIEAIQQWAECLALPVENIRAIFTALDLSLLHINGFSKSLPSEVRRFKHVSLSGNGLYL